MNSPKAGEVFYLKPGESVTVSRPRISVKCADIDSFIVARIIIGIDNTEYGYQAAFSRHALRGTNTKHYILHALERLAPVGTSWASAIDWASVAEKIYSYFCKTEPPRLTELDKECLQAII